MTILKQIATVDEMAEKFEVTPRTVRNWCENGDLEARKFNKEWIVVKDQKNPKLLNADIKIKGLRKAVGEFNRWEDAARIYFDREDLSVEVFVYTDLNNWEDFRDYDVVEVHNKGSFAFGTEGEISMKSLKQKCLDAL